MKADYTIEEHPSVFTCVETNSKRDRAKKVFYCFCEFLYKNTWFAYASGQKKKVTGLCRQALCVNPQTL